MSAARVSIVIPAFNAEAFIADAIRSALAQTVTDIEIIVVDDASTDHTVAVVQDQAKADGRVRALRLRRNQGPAAARNRGIEAACGQWIALLDADDRFLPERLEKLLDMAEEQDADIVSDNLLLQPGATPMFPLAGAHRERLTAAAFVQGNIGSRSNPRRSLGFMQPVFRRSFLQEHRIRYEERNRFGEDFLLALDCLTQGANWWITPEPMYEYSVRAGSLTEVQASADLRRIVERERALLDDPRICDYPALNIALRRHATLVERNYCYRAFTDAVKEGRAAEAAELIFSSGRSLRHVMGELAVQAPVIAAKALRGGYFRHTSGVTPRPA